MYVARNIEFRRRLTALAVTDVFAVDPQVEGGAHGAEFDEHTFTGPGPGHVEIPPVGADGVVLGRDIRFVDLERVRYVDVNRVTVAFAFPVRRHRDRCPPRDIELRPVELRRTAVGRGRVVKMPVAVKQPEPGVCLGVPGNRGFP